MTISCVTWGLGTVQTGGQGCRQTPLPPLPTHKVCLNSHSGGETEENKVWPDVNEHQGIPEIPNCFTVVSLSLQGGHLCPGQTHITMQKFKCTITRALQSKSPILLFSWSPLLSALELTIFAMREVLCSAILFIYSLFPHYSIFITRAKSQFTRSFFS